MTELSDFENFVIYFLPWKCFILLVYFPLSENEKYLLNVSYFYGDNMLYSSKVLIVKGRYFQSILPISESKE